MANRSGTENIKCKDCSLIKPIGKNTFACGNECSPNYGKPVDIFKDGDCSPLLWIARNKWI